MFTQLPRLSGSSVLRLFGPARFGGHQWVGEAEGLCRSRPSSTQMWLFKPVCHSLVEQPLMHFRKFLFSLLGPLSKFIFIFTKGLRSFHLPEQLQKDYSLDIPRRHASKWPKRGESERNSYKPQSAGSEAAQDLVTRSPSPLCRPVAYQVPRTLSQPMKSSVVDLLRVLNVLHKS
jgi:hypothetical protein